MKVPVGMGVVVPAYRILEILELPILKELREDFRRRMESDMSATPTMARASGSRPPTTDENPSHKEDFTRLLNAAVKPPQSDEQT